MVRMCRMCNKDEYNFPKLSFHRFPVNPLKRGIWFALLGIEEGKTFPKNCDICSIHFDERSFHFKDNGNKYLNKDANPLPTWTEVLDKNNFRSESDTPRRISSNLLNESSIRSITENIGKSTNEMETDTARSYDRGHKQFCIPGSSREHFPSNETRRGIWFPLVGFDVDKKLAKRPEICSDHFDKSDFRYKRNGLKYLKPEANTRLQNPEIFQLEPLSSNSGFETYPRREVYPTQLLSTCTENDKGLNNQEAEVYKDSFVESDIFAPVILQPSTSTTQLSLSKNIDIRSTSITIPEIEEQNISVLTDVQTATHDSFLKPISEYKGKHSLTAVSEKSNRDIAGKVFCLFFTYHCQIERIVNFELQCVIQDIMEILDEILTKSPEATSNLITKKSLSRYEKVYELFCQRKQVYPQWLVEKYVEEAIEGRTN